MVQRTTNYIAVFSEPFRLATLDGEIPAGSYSVLRHEEMMESMAAIAYRLTGSFIRLPAIGRNSARIQMVPIADAELAKAVLEMDGLPETRS